MRALIFELGPGAVEDGLVAALAQHASRVGARTGWSSTSAVRRAASRSRPRTETQLFGIGREALANVVKHAQAGTAWIRVEARPARVVLEIRDDGCGFDPAARHPGHFGLESMRSRAAEIGGVLTITSAPEPGTVVRVEVPAESGPSARMAPEPDSKIRVLVVDDHAVVRRGLLGLPRQRAGPRGRRRRRRRTEALELLAAGLRRAATGRRPHGPADGARRRHRGDA